VTLFRMNLRAMVKYDLTPHEALVIATSEPGRFLQEPLGQVRAGMFADIIVLGANPSRTSAKPPTCGRR
jgi:imidazolonepropionase-like amidohydrolase